LTAHDSIRAAADTPPRMPPRRAVGFAAVAIVVALTQSCSPPPPPLAGPDPSDPRARVPAAAYRPVSYVSRRPVEPLSSGEQNERIAPVPQP
jgi:hypothetical protein